MGQIKKQRRNYVNSGAQLPILLFGLGSKPQMLLFKAVLSKKWPKKNMPTEHKQYAY